MNDDDLDQLLDSIDIDCLPSADIELKQSQMNIDDLLDDVANSVLIGEPSPTMTLPVELTLPVGDDDLGELHLEAHQESLDQKEWLSAIGALPLDLRNKWSSLYNSDSNITRQGRFLASDNYLDSHSEKQQPSKLFQAVIRRALKRCHVGELKINEIMAGILSDPAVYEDLLLSFQEELLISQKAVVEMEPEYVDSNGMLYNNIREFYAEQGASGEGAGRA